MFLLYALLLGSVSCAAPPTHRNVPHRKASLLQLLVCLQKHGTPLFDVEVWEESVRRKDVESFHRHRLCDTPLKICLPPSNIKRKTANDRYLASLILESFELCRDVRHHPPPEDTDVDERSTTFYIVLSAIVLLNFTGILGGIVYKYQSDCSLRSKNLRRDVRFDPVSADLDG